MCIQVTKVKLPCLLKLLLLKGVVSLYVNVGERTPTNLNNIEEGVEDKGLTLLSNSIISG